MKLLLAALLAGSAAAFAPSAVERTSVSLDAKAKPKAKAVSVGFSGELGAQAPLGFWDPLGLLNDADQERFDRLRYVELKHGRISMLAVLGHIVTSSGFRLAGDIDYSGTSFASIPSGLAAAKVVPAAGLAQIFAFVGLLELQVMKDITGGEFVGDFRNGALDFGWDKLDDETKASKRGIELNNGRAAQMGILALMVHEQLPSHDPYVINALLGSPVDFNAGF